MQQSLKVALVIGCLSPLLQAFVFISGPDEATLDVNADAPSAVFVLSNDVPKLSGQDTFMGGKYKNLSDEDFWRALITEAMKPWNDVGDAYLQLELGSSQDISNDEDDKIHSIAVDDVNATVAAFARPRVEGNIIEDCDITVGTKKTSAKSMAFTMMHELGHCLGLGHSHTNYDAVMGYSRTSETLRLGLDDIAGVIYLYPDPDLDAPRETLGCARLGGSAAASSPFILLFIFMLPLLLIRVCPRPR